MHDDWKRSSAVADKQHSDLASFDSTA